MLSQESVWYHCVRVCGHACESVCVAQPHKSGVSEATLCGSLELPYVQAGVGAEESPG